MEWFGVSVVHSRPAAMMALVAFVLQRLTRMT